MGNAKFLGDSHDAVHEEDRMVLNISTSIQHPAEKKHINK